MLMTMSPKLFSENAHDVHMAFFTILSILIVHEKCKRNQLKLGVLNPSLNRLIPGGGAVVLYFGLALDSAEISKLEQKYTCQFM